MTRSMLALFILALVGVAHADETSVTVTTGTATLAVSRHDALGNPNIIAIRLTWESSADGNVIVQTARFHGTLLRVVINPASDAPTDNYDLTITDEDGADILQALGANRDTANTEQLVPLIGNGTTTAQPVSFANQLTFNITNAGDANNGEIVLYVERP